jgi:hypothetical protein
MLQKGEAIDSGGKTFVSPLIDQWKIEMRNKAC